MYRNSPYIKENSLQETQRPLCNYLWKGKKNAEIADRLNISTETVHTLKKIAYKK
ncbi:hypothetical protein DW047_11250, partial [Phocaeicola vulgatus]